MKKQVILCYLIGLFCTPSLLWAQEQASSETQNTKPAELLAKEAQTETKQSNALEDKVQNMESQIELLKSEIAKSKTDKSQISMPNTGTTPQPALDQKNFSILRKRTHSLNWRYQTISSELSGSQGNLHSSETSRVTELEFGYSRNFGLAEIGLSINSQYTEISGVKQTVPSFAISGEFNFIENTPGIDFVPFAAAQIGLIGINLKDGTSEYEVSGSAASLGVGFKWFPFSELFALELGLNFVAGKMDNLASPKLEVDVRQTDFKVGWRLYF